MDVVREQLCHGCGKRHESAFWHYRQEQDARVWLCRLKYLFLDREDKQLWMID